MRLSTIVFAVLLAIVPSMVSASPNFGHMFQEAGEDKCAIAGSWAIYESPFSGQPEFLGLREVPLIASVAAFEFSSTDDAETFVRGLSDEVKESLAADKYLGAVDTPKPLAFPDIDESSTSFQVVIDPDEKSVHRFTIYVVVVAIQRGEFVSLVMNYNSMAELASEFLWDVIDSYDSRWDADSADVVAAMAQKDDLPPEYDEPAESAHMQFDGCTGSATPET